MNSATHAHPNTQYVTQKSNARTRAQTQFVGQTKEKVRSLMDQARGGVLFIDEAYDLGGPGFGHEAMNTLLGLMTEPE